MVMMTVMAMMLLVTTEAALTDVLLVMVAVTRARIGVGMMVVASEGVCSS